MAGTAVCGSVLKIGNGGDAEGYVRLTFLLYANVWLITRGLHAIAVGKLPYEANVASLLVAVTVLTEAGDEETFLILIVCCSPCTRRRWGTPSRAARTWWLLPCSLASGSNSSSTETRPRDSAENSARNVRTVYVPWVGETSSAPTSFVHADALAQTNAFHFSREHENYIGMFGINRRIGERSAERNDIYSSSCVMSFHQRRKSFVISDLLPQ